jgi:hypothetical protein
MSYSKEFNHNGRRAAGIRVQKTPTPPAEELEHADQFTGKHCVKITMPRLAWLERPLPDFWDMPASWWHNPARRS